MNRCPECNKRLRKNAESCPRCGWKERKSIFRFFSKKQQVVTGSCQYCGKIFYHDETCCSRCGWKVKKYRAGFGLLLISFLLPFFGSRYGEDAEFVAPRKALECKIAARIGYFFYFALFIFAIIYFSVMLP